MLNADIDIVKSNIALTELRAPFDGIIGLRNVSEGAYASPSVVVAKLTKISPLKIDFLRPGALRQPDPARNKALIHHRGAPGALRGRSLCHRDAGRRHDPHARRARPLPECPGTAVCPGASPRSRSGCTRSPTPSPCPPKPSSPKWASTRSSSTATGRPMPSRSPPDCAPNRSIQIINGLSVGDTLITSGTLQLREGLPVTLDNID